MNLLSTLKASSLIEYFFASKYFSRSDRVLYKFALNY